MMLQDGLPLHLGEPFRPRRHPQLPVQTNEVTPRRTPVAPHQCRGQLQGIRGAEFVPLEAIFRQFANLGTGLYFAPRPA